MYREVQPSQLSSNLSNARRRGYTAKTRVHSEEGITSQMALLKQTTSQLQTQEDDIYKALKAWYLTPGIQRDLRNKENGAVQLVLEVLERRRAAAHKTVRTDHRSAATKPR